MKNFSLHLKQEMFQSETYRNVKRFLEMLSRYMRWYNNQRVQLRLAGDPPMAYRQTVWAIAGSAGLEQTLLRLKNLQCKITCPIETQAKPGNITHSTVDAVRPVR